MARRPCATRSPRRSRPSLTSCVDRSPGPKALRCHSTLNCGLTLAWLCTSVNLTARGSVAATRTPTACYVSTSRRAQISPDTPPTISLLSLPTSTAALARPSDGRPPPRRSTSIYYRFNQPALRRPLESAQPSPIRAGRSRAHRRCPPSLRLSLGGDLHRLAGHGGAAIRNHQKEPARGVARGGTQTLTRCATSPLAYCGTLRVALNRFVPSGPRIDVALRWYLDGPASARVGDAG